MRTTTGAVVILALCACTARAQTISVNVNDAECVTGSGQPDPYAVVYCSIQDAIDDSVAGDTISVAPGTYTQPLNLDNLSDLTIVGADRDTVIIQPNSTLDWGTPYGSDRQVAVRVYESTDIALLSLTFDFGLVAGNNVYGVVYWDATGTLGDNVLKNMSLSDAGGYYDEIASFLGAPTFGGSNPLAEITVSDNEFVDTGRAAIVAHEFVYATISGNTFYKTTDDYGYAIELGSESGGVVTHNTIFGYDTPAASDGRPSAGVRIDNSLTAGSSGITKSVSVARNEVYDCQYGLWIGNRTDGSAGDVDIDATVWGNYIHDNLEVAILVQDEDAADGSSVTASFQNNVLLDNGGTGYLIYTAGDGDINASLENETIIGHDLGVHLNDAAGGASTSVYDVAITHSQIAGTTAAVLNDYSGTQIDAELNWWGDASGPLDTVGSDEAGNPPCYDPATMVNADGLGDAVSEQVDYCPWLATLPARLSLEADAACYSVGDPVTVGIWMHDISDTIVGGQFFLEYDNTILDYQSVTTGDPPFTTTVFSVVDEDAGTIDYAVGLPDGGSGTSDDTMMAVITFQALAQICSEENLVAFRFNSVPTRLGNDESEPVYPLLANLDVIDGAAPTATQGTIEACYATVAEAESAALAATADPTDNCTDPNDIVISVATVGDCDAVVTVTLTDECSNSSDYVYYTRIDDAPPTATQGTIDACYASAAEAEAAAIAATTDPTDNCSDPNDIEITAGSDGDCSATVTVTVADECGNSTDYVYDTRIDGTPPAATQGDIDACYATAAEAEAAALAATTDPTDNCTDPNDIVISVATVGDCSAVVTVTLTDECSNSSDYVYNTRIDDTPPTATQGTIDACYTTAVEAEAAALAATTDPADDCSDPNDIVLTATAEGDCDATVTVTVTDECGYFTDYVYNTRIDGTPPTATPGTIDACYATTAEAEAAALAATTDPSDNCTDPNDIVVTVATVGDCDAAVTVTVTDECGNSTDYVYDTRVDDTPPTATQGTMDACYTTVAEAEAAALAATDPSDNCTDPNDIVVTVATVGDCDALLTVTLTDECSNFSDYVYNTRIDDAPPTATPGTIDTCYASMAEAEAAAIAATTDPNDNCSDPNDIVLSAATVGDCDATVTVTVSDECGNASDYDYTTRVDGEAPVVTPPAGVDVHADAGLCTALLDPGAASAEDNCTLELTVTGTRSDALELTDPYPQGVTTITWESTDECGNTGNAIQTITVGDYNELVVDLELKAITQPTLTRCITFEFWNCTTETSETVEQEIAFTDGSASAVSVEVPCGEYDCLRVRDGLHSLWRTDFDDFGIVGTQYAANFTDASGGGDDDALIHGNLYDDEPPYAPPQFIDIMDYAVFINNWGVDYTTGDTTCDTAWPHADLSGDGEVTSADFTFIQTYFLYTDEVDCCALLSGGTGPRTSVSVAELDQLGLSELAVADLNDDGWVDTADVAAFAGGARPDGPGLIQQSPGVPNGGAKIGTAAAEPTQP